VTIAEIPLSTYNATFNVSSLNTAAKTFQINGTAAIPARVPAATATVTNGTRRDLHHRDRHARQSRLRKRPGGDDLGASPGNYNGTFNITVINANSFKYTMTAAPGSTGNATGTIIATGTHHDRDRHRLARVPSTFSGTVSVNGRKRSGLQRLQGGPRSPAAQHHAIQLTRWALPAIGANTNALG
jgi:hypothetical protein